MKIQVTVSVTCLLLCCCASAQVGYGYKLFENPGATITRVFGLNDHGQVVGADDSTPGRHAFLLSKKNYITLDSTGTLGTHTSFARGVNNPGDVVGGYFDDEGNEHGFLTRKGVVTVLDVPFAGSLGTQLNAINDSGVIVGAWVDGAFTVHGFVYQSGVFAHLDYPGSLDTFPFGINPQGEIVGNWDTDQSTVGHGFVFTRGRMFSFDVPGAAPDATAANGINTRGHIVGAYVDVNGGSHGFLAVGSSFTTLDCPGAIRTTAWGIDAAGQIAGTCDTANQRLGFIANPLPTKKP